MMGQGCASQEPYALYRTDDGGSRWSLRLVGPGACGRANEPGYPANPTYGLAGYPLGFSALGTDDAWLAVFSPASSRLDLESTADGGQSWKRFGSISGDFDSVSMAFVSSTQGWLVARGRVPFTTRNITQVFHTMDGGQTWIKTSVTP